MLDLDATDIELPGGQEGRFFHGDDDHDCDLPLTMFCGEDYLRTKLRSADRDGTDGSIQALAQIVAPVRVFAERQYQTLDC